MPIYFNVFAFYLGCKRGQGSRIQSNIVICDTRCVPSYSNISGTKLQCLFRWWNDDCLLCIDGVESVYRMCRYQYCQYCHIGIISVQYSKHSIIRGHHLHTHGTIHFLYWIWHHCWLLDIIPNVCVLCRVPQFWHISCCCNCILQKLSHFKNLNRHSNKFFPHWNRNTCQKTFIANQNHPPLTLADNFNSKDP